MSAAPEPPYHPGSLRSMFEAYWPHRDTYSGRAVLRRIIAAMKTNREVTRGW